MKNYVITTDNIVTTIMSSDIAPIPNSDQLLHEVEDSPELGDIWDGSSFNTAANKIRVKRYALLADTDWMANSDVNMSDEWRTYRQALRDIPQQVGFPTTVVWPTKS